MSLCPNCQVHMESHGWGDESCPNCDYTSFQCYDCGEWPEICDICDEKCCSDGCDSSSCTCENKCHICGIPTDKSCDFDLEMNSLSEPKPCCGCHSCAEDV